MQRKTEQLYQMDAPLDALPLTQAAQAMATAQSQAASCVADCAEDLANAATAMAKTVRDDGMLVYAAAGSSGLMAAADAMELGGTFGIPASRVRILMAGGIPTTADMPGDVEDQSATLASELAAIGASDCVITLSASGSTAYAVSAARIARSKGATVIAIACNAEASLFDHAQHTIFLDTPPEILSGSTRLGAGTAQKIALNTLSTLMGVALGHVYQGLMVNVFADNTKLKQRAQSIVRQITGVSPDTADRALELAGGKVKQACLIATGCTLDQANDTLASTGGHLGPALANLETKFTTKNP